MDPKSGKAIISWVGLGKWGRRENNPVCPRGVLISNFFQIKPNPSLGFSNNFRLFPGFCGSLLFSD